MTFQAALHYRSVTSTNDVLRAMLGQGSPVGTVVVADEQTRGRGQLGRSWHSPAGESLYMSASVKADDPRPLPFVAAVAVCKAVEDTCGLAPGVRWPNDVYIKEQKLAGVLIESAAKKNIWIIGCGVNVNNSTFPIELFGKATSCLLEVGDSVSVKQTEKRLLHHLEQTLEALSVEGFDSVLAEWRKRDITQGKLIKVAAPDGECLVEAVDVDGQGRLIARSNGELTVFESASSLQWQHP